MEKPFISTNRPVKVEDLELLDYEKAHAYQLLCLQQPEDRVLLVEHPEVYTHGRKSHDEFPSEKNHFLVERGGETTYHNPGQVVLYPILHLQDKERDLHWVLRGLEEITIAMLKDFGIHGERKEGATGVWVERQTRKIASIGIAVKGWVTYHGLAVNVDNDLSGFQAINPCGFSSQVMIRMKDLLGETCPSRFHVKERLLFHFASQFHRTIIPSSLLQ